MSHVRSLVLSLTCLGLWASAGGAARADEPAPAPAASDEAPIPWVKVWGDAKAQAKKDKKDLLINFTGSDWCGWCKRLEGEVFSHAKFLESATKQYVFVFMDFPNDPELKKQVADPVLAQNLFQSYAGMGYPTIILANADGQPYARTGYQEGGPEGYLKHIEELRKNREKIAALLATGKTDPLVFKAGFEVLTETEHGGFLGYADYAWVVDLAEKQDADGSKGYKKLVADERARQRSAVEEKQIDALVKATPKGQSPVPAIYEFLKTSKDLRGMLLWKASMACANWLLHEKKDFAEAKRLFQLPLRDPEIAGNEDAKRAVEEALKQCDEAAKAAEAPPQEPKPAEPKPADPEHGTMPK